MTPLEAKRKKFPGAIGVAAFHGIWRVANGEFAAGRIDAAREADTGDSVPVVRAVRDVMS